MTNHLHLVFSNPPDTVSEADFNAWYDAHVQEILSVDGWESATRYNVDAVVGAGDSPSFRFLSLYELSCPAEIAVANLEAAGMGSADKYVERKDVDEGELPLPEWFTRIRFGSWNCARVSERIVLHQSAK